MQSVGRSVGRHVTALQRTPAGRQAGRQATATAVTSFGLAVLHSHVFHPDLHPAAHRTGTCNCDVPFVMAVPLQ